QTASSAAPTARASAPTSRWLLEGRTEDDRATERPAVDLERIAARLADPHIGGPVLRSLGEPELRWRDAATVEAHPVRVVESDAPHEHPPAIAGIHEPEHFRHAPERRVNVGSAPRQRDRPVSPADP